MANNYCQSSSMLLIPAEKLEQATLIVERVTDEMENAEDGYVGFEATFQKDALWIHDDGESIDTEHVVVLVQELLDELEIDEPFIFSWAYTCSKPRVDEFGGGACAVRRGKDPIWCDARNEVECALGDEVFAPEANPWCHMDTAPKDGTRVLLWVNFSDGANALLAFFTGDDWQDVYEGCGIEPDIIQAWTPTP